VFWACGVTPQSVIAMVKPDFCITHSRQHAGDGPQEYRICDYVVLPFRNAPKARQAYGNIVRVPSFKSGRRPDDASSLRALQFFAQNAPARLLSFHG